MNPLPTLRQSGQYVWMDYLRRSLIVTGRLRRLIDEDGLGGVTSNPTIVARAITESTDYDAGLRRALDVNRDVSNRALAQRLVVEDIQLAADILRPVYDGTNGENGFVSLEVSPGVAHDTYATVAEARSLWRELARPNVMIKVPATSEAIPAVEALTADGINVNITLMFSLEHYEAMAHAYLRGLDRHTDPRRVVSVASVFVSRLDVETDRLLDAIGSTEALSLRGRVAIANARRIYRRFREIFHGEPFAALKRRGARIQRPLWASTGTKSASYSDVFYLEALIGPDTIATVPPATMAAFRDHGRVRVALGTDREGEADAVLASAAALGLDVHAIAEQLQEDEIQESAASSELLLASLAEKRCHMLTAVS
jgi:transaldolase